MKRNNILLLMLALVGTGSNATTLDQNTIIDFGARSIEIGWAQTSYFNGGFRRSQTFTAGIAGYLDKLVVDFNLNESPATSVSSVKILQTDATGTPTDTILATVTALSWKDNLGTFDFSASHLQLNANVVYAFEVVGGVIRANNSGIPDSPVAAHYEGGSDFYTYAVWDNWVANPAADLRFQTYMSEVPLPASLVLFGSALAGLATSRKLATWRARR